jgi:hypothetical protein
VKSSNSTKSMNKLLNPILTAFLMLAFMAWQPLAEELYVDPVKGNNENRGSLKEPLATLAKAVDLGNAMSGQDSITIRLAPGVYILNDKLTINPSRNSKDRTKFTIEAVVLPDDEVWSPDKMPLIQSVSANNSTEQFPHAVGILVGTHNVTIRGLKFLGNPNPTVKYYYPITKEDESLRGMHVSQCYFISEKHSMPIQGGIWAHGPDTDINHCVFYNCRNAILLFKSVSGFSIAHTIIYGANESAIWMGPIDSGFVFKNNVVAKSHCFWVRPENSSPAYEISSCLIADTDIYMGYYSRKGVVSMPVERNSRIKEINIAKTGAVKLVEKNNERLPAQHLHLTPDSAGFELGAGIFRKKATQ